jgi:hypothetical protein
MDGVLGLGALVSSGGDEESMGGEEELMKQTREPEQDLSPKLSRMLREALPARVHACGMEPWQQ